MARGTAGQLAGGTVWVQVAGILLMEKRRLVLRKGKFKIRTLESSQGCGTRS